MDLCGKPLIQHVVERVQQVAGVQHLVLAVPASDQAAFAGLAPLVWGFPDLADDDVLGRFARVAQQFPAIQTIMRVTGDCPLFSPQIAGQVVEFYRSSGCDYAWNVTPGYTDGTDCEVFSRAALLWANEQATDAADREHVTPWIRRYYHVATLPAPWPLRSPEKISVDTLDDLERVRELMGHVEPV
jgi:spore coat polysaccharide biosynthesis protein SpsF (cytidylyltransferase family)